MSNTIETEISFEGGTLMRVGLIVTKQRLTVLELEAMADIERKGTRRANCLTKLQLKTD